MLEQKAESNEYILLLKKALSNTKKLCENLIENHYENVYFNERTLKFIYENQIDMKKDYGMLTDLNIDWNFNTKPISYFEMEENTKKNILVSDSFFNNETPKIVATNSKNKYTDTVQNHCIKKLNDILKVSYQNILNKVDYIYYNPNDILSINFFLTKGDQINIDSSNKNNLDVFIDKYIELDTPLSVTVESKIINAMLYSDSFKQVFYIKYNALEKIGFYKKIVPFLTKNSKFNHNADIQESYLCLIGNLSTNSILFKELINNQFALSFIDICLNNLRKTNIYTRYGLRERINISKKIMIYNEYKKNNLLPVIILNSASDITRIKTINDNKMNILYDLGNIKQILTNDISEYNFYSMNKINHIFILKAQWEEINQLYKSFINLDKNSFSYSQKDLSINLELLIKYFDQYIASKKIEIIDDLTTYFNQKIHYI